MTGPSALLFLAIGSTIICQEAFSYDADAVGVLIWGQTISPDLSEGNPFRKTSESEFAQILNSRVGPRQNPVAVFLKESLCIEDLVQHKENLKQTTKDASVQYLPAVVHPVSVIEELSYNQTDSSDVNALSNGQLVMKPIGDLSTLPDMYKMLKESTPDLIAVLTGKYCSYSRSERVRRDTPTVAPNDYFIPIDRFLFYASEPPMIKTTKDGKYESIGKPISTSSHGQGTRKEPFVVHMEFDPVPSLTNKFSFDFVFDVETAGYYSLKNILLKPSSGSETPLYTNADIVFPYNFSYHCTQKTVFYNESIYLNITDMQFQIDAKNERFDDAYDCIGFTSIPIWTGLFVTAILGLIMIWALTMIMDIRTMDRFDDPKGKTITISAQE